MYSRRAHHRLVGWYAKRLCKQVHAASIDESPHRAPCFRHAMAGGIVNSGGLTGMAWLQGQCAPSCSFQLFPAAAAVAAQHLLLLNCCHWKCWHGASARVACMSPALHARVFTCHATMDMRSSQHRCAHCTHMGAVPEFCIACSRANVLRGNAQHMIGLCSKCSASCRVKHFCNCGCFGDQQFAAIIQAAAASLLNGCQEQQCWVTGSMQQIIKARVAAQLPCVCLDAKDLSMLYAGGSSLAGPFNDAC
jgi:hypothetical protein